MSASLAHKARQGQGQRVRPGGRLLVQVRRAGKGYLAPPPPLVDGRPRRPPLPNYGLREGRRRQWWPHRKVSPQPGPLKRIFFIGVAVRQRELQG